MPGPDKFSRFERAILPHLDAAYNLARWLMRNEDEAADAVQDACLRALRFIGGFRGGDGRVWLLAIVRNTCYSRLKRGAIREHETEFDDEIHSPEIDAANPETLLERSRDSETLRHALEDLPEEFREIVVMRELEGMAYGDRRGCRSPHRHRDVAAGACPQAFAATAHYYTTEGVLK